MKKMVGLFRVMTFEELDKAAEVMVKYSPTDAYQILDETFAKTVKGDTFRRKALNNLMKVWGNGQKPLSDFQEKVLERYAISNYDEKKSLQVLMMLYSFSFFSDTINIIGKYLRMQDTFQSKTIMEEVRSTYGMTETVNKGVLTVLGSLVDWGFLFRSKPGVYELTKDKILITDEFIKNVLIRSILAHTDAEYLPLEIINNQAGLFMFDYQVSRLEVHLDDLNVLRERTDTFIGLK